jgi:hypothetical protein
MEGKYDVDKLNAATRFHFTFSSAILRKKIIPFILGDSMSKLYSPLVCLFTLLFSFAATASAQSIWHAYQSPKEFSVEYIHPNFKDFIGTFTGYAINLTGRIALKEDKTLTIQVPYAKAPKNIIVFGFPFMKTRRRWETYTSASNPEEIAASLH